MAEFTTDWTSHNYPTWERVLGRLRDADLDILEIGSWEGRSALWFLNYLPNSKIACVDTFEGSEEHRSSPDLELVERRFDANVAPYGARVEKIKQSSQQALARLGLDIRRFDLIYVDGSNLPADVYADGVLAWPLLRRDGIIIFDDYGWAGDNYRPRWGIDAFLLEADHRVIHAGYQMIIGKR